MLKFFAAVAMITFSMIISAIFHKWIVDQYEKHEMIVNSKMVSVMRILYYKIITPRYTLRDAFEEFMSLKLLPSELDIFWTPETEALPFLMNALYDMRKLMLDKTSDPGPEVQEFLQEYGNYLKGPARRPQSPLELNVFEGVSEIIGRVTSQVPPFCFQIACEILLNPDFWYNLLVYFNLMFMISSIMFGVIPYAKYKPIFVQILFLFAMFVTYSMLFISLNLSTTAEFILGEKVDVWMGIKLKEIMKDWINSPFTTDPDEDIDPEENFFIHPNRIPDIDKTVKFVKDLITLYDDTDLCTGNFASNLVSANSKSQRLYTAFKSKDVCTTALKVLKKHFSKLSETEQRTFIWAGWEGYLRAKSVSRQIKLDPEGDYVLQLKKALLSWSNSSVEELIKIIDS